MLAFVDKANKKEITKCSPTEEDVHPTHFRLHFCASSEFTRHERWRGDPWEEGSIGKEVGGGCVDMKRR
jgi:hypothetical protein